MKLQRPRYSSTPLSCNTQANLLVTMVTINIVVFTHRARDSGTPSIACLHGSEIKPVRTGSVALRSIPKLHTGVVKLPLLIFPAYTV